MNAESVNALFPAALVLTGVLINLTRLVEEDAMDKIPSLLFAVCYPCIIIRSIAKTDFTEIITGNALPAVYVIAERRILREKIYSSKNFGIGFK